MASHGSLSVDNRNRTDHFWALTGDEVVQKMESNSVSGLSEKEAKRRLQHFGVNSIEHVRQDQILTIFLRQFISPLIFILLFAAIVTLVLGHIQDSLFIFAALLVNSLLGFYQEYKAERALAGLKSYLKERTRVIRDGREFEIDSTEIVPGDIVRLNQGDRVPADGRLVFTNDLRIDEALLTGEALPAEKRMEPVSPNSVLGDRTSMVFAGTLVTQGIGTVVISATSTKTEIGKIASLVAHSGNEKTPLQKRINRFSLGLGLFLGALTVAIFFIGLHFGYSTIDMFLIAVAISVAAVPEGLPIALTVILAVGVERMARRKGVIRKLIAAEALGSASVIITDKTGTLTMAKLELDDIIETGEYSKNELLELSLLNTNVLVENPQEDPTHWRMSGRMIETVLVQKAAEQGHRDGQAKEKFHVRNTLPFNAVNKFSVAHAEHRGKHFLAFLGAPDVLIHHADCPEEKRKQYQEMMNSLAGSGRFVIGVATKGVASSEYVGFSKSFNPKGLTFQGFISFRDPVRPHVKSTIEKISKAGIGIVIVTGDHHGTAVAIAQEVGIPLPAGSVLNASELRFLSDREFRKRIPELRVIARVSPEDKMRIVRAYQANGDIVAMTGDGVNDAPSIKQADVGIAMGSGTQVSRDVADLVLLDDNLETIVASIEEGRQIMENIRKVLVYLLSSVTDALLLIGGSLLLGLTLPMNALQILWVNFFSDSFPAVAFAFEKGTDGLSHRVPRRQSGLFDPITRFLVLYVGISTSVLLLALYFVLLRADFSPDVVRTFIYASFGTYTLILTFSLKSLKRSIFSYSPFSNIFLIAGVTIGIVLMVVSIYVPFFQKLFDTTPLSYPWILGVLSIGIFNIILVEIGKLIYRKQ